MKRKRLNFMDIKEEDTLGREEMKFIMAGCGGDTNCLASCKKDSDCNGGSSNTCNTCCQGNIAYHQCVTSC